MTSAIARLGAFATLATLAMPGVAGAAEMRPASGSTGPESDRASVDDSPSKPPASKPLWVDGGVGWQHLDLTTFRIDRNSDGDALTADLVPRTVSGPTAHLGLGVRLLVLTLGLRAGVAAFQDSSPTRSVNDMQLYSIDAELGLRIPIGRVEPYLLLGGGYSAFGGLDDAIEGVSRGLAMDGANLRVGLGLDLYVSPAVSLGARITEDFLFLSRAGVPLRNLATPQQVSTIGEAKTRLIEGDGASIGTAFNLTIGPGVHF